VLSVVFFFYFQALTMALESLHPQCLLMVLWLFWLELEGEIIPTLKHVSYNFVFCGFRDMVFFNCFSL